MRTSIASVTVTFNSAPRIVEHLRTLVAQTMPMDEIIVVDNASTDRTAAIVAQEFPSVKLLEVGSNMGVGAYGLGMEYACARGHDWVWTLDDDSRPRPTTISELLAAFEAVSQEGKVGLIAPLPINGTTERPYPLWLWDNGFVSVPVDDKSGEFLEVDMTISSGSLIRREAIEAVGLPRADFFMDWMDYEYCLRIRQSGYRIVVVKDCEMPHFIGSHQSISLPGWRLDRCVHAPFREYYKTRNLAFIVWNQRPHPRAKAFVLRQFAEHVVGTILFDSQKLRRLHMMCAGLRDGIRGNLEPRVKTDLPPTAIDGKDQSPA